MKLSKAKKKIEQDIYNKCIPEGQEVPIVIWLNDKKSDDCYICKTCFNRLKKGKMPAECVQNNMQVDPQPEELKLTELEGSLISRNIQFMKIYQLPTSRYTALKDKIINVPVPEGSALNTINSRLLHLQHLGGIWIGQDQYRLPLAPLNEFPEPWC